MAASETVNIQKAESVINRWLVDYYLFLVLDLLEKKQYNDFCAIRDVVNSIMVRPFESSEVTPKKIRVLEFLFLINEGEQLDGTSEADLSPLESALKVLESMRKDCPQLDYDKVCSSLKDMIVKIFIVNQQFDKAEKTLKHFPKSMHSKKVTYMALINQKSSVHDTIDQINFSQFREQMLVFCQKLCQFTPPFLLKAAVKLIGSRHTESDDNVDEPEQQGPPEQRCCEQDHFQQSNRVFMEKSRLEAGFNALADEMSFKRLEEEEEQAQNKVISLHLSPSPEGANEEVEDPLFQRTSNSPLEASPADEPAQICDVPQPQTSSLSNVGIVPKERRQYTIAQLVVEPDSPVTSPALNNELTIKETPEKSPEKSLEKSKNTDNTLSPIMECEISKPMRKRSFKSCDRTKATSEGKMATTTNEDLSDSDEIVRPVQNTSSNRGNEDMEIEDGLDGSPSPSILRAAPQTSSTPHKDKSSPHSKWKQAFNSAKESKEVWSDEEAVFDDGSSNDSFFSNSGHRRKKWTDSETERLKEGVQKFGEGSWCKIKAYCKFKDRTNVNLKDRWRTMKKLKMV